VEAEPLISRDELTEYLFTVIDIGDHPKWYEEQMERSRRFRELLERRVDSTASSPRPRAGRRAALLTDNY